MEQPEITQYSDIHPTAGDGYPPASFTLGTPTSATATNRPNRGRFDYAGEKSAVDAAAQPLYAGTAFDAAADIPEVLLTTWNLTSAYTMAR